MPDKNVSTDSDVFFTYLPFSDEDEKLGMICTTAGSVETPPETEYPPRKNEYPQAVRSVAEGRTLKEFQILYISRGRGSLEVHGQLHEMSQGSAFLAIPGIPHKYKPVYETGWHEYWVGFKGSFFDSMIEKDILSLDHLLFNPGINSRIIENFRLILEEVKAQKPLFQYRACAGIVTLLMDIFTLERRNEQPNYYEEIVEKAKIIMEDNCFSNISITEISGQSGVSVPRLNEIFKAYTSMTPYQYFIHIKIQKAKNLLTQKDASVKEVAYKLGFDDQFYFSRLFKNKTGFSPSELKH